MSIRSLENQFHSANFTGRFNQANLTSSGCLTHAITLALRNTHNTGLKALGHRVAINAIVSAGCSLTIDRVMSPLAGLTALSSGSFIDGLYPIAEVTFGRGTNAPDFLPTNFFSRQTVGYGWGEMTQYGLIGTVLEALPMRLAAAAEAKGANTLAQACIAGAIIGRCALQIPRAAISLWAIKETVYFIAVFTAVCLLIEGIARGVRSGIDTVSARQPGDHVARFRILLDHFIEDASRQMVGIIAQNTPVDQLRIRRDTGGPGVHGRVAQQTNAALRRFMDIQDTELENGRQVRETADAIANDLRHYCAHTPDNSALRGGLAILRDFIENTFDDVNWTCPIELAQLS